MINSRQELGKRGEEMACDFLREKGYLILEKNYRTRYGEIDIVAEKEGTVVFVEVKTRATGTFGWPEEAIDARKQHKLALTAEHYLAVHHLYNKNYQIDSVGIVFGNGGEIREIRQEENIVGW